MALTPDDIRKMTAYQKSVYELEQKKTEEKREQRKLEEDAAKLEEERTLKLSDQLKLNKASVKAGKEYTKTLQQGEKSISGILGALLQGNVAQAAEISLSKKALDSTKKRAEENKKITQGLKTDNDFGELNAENKMKVLSLVQDINSGMADTVSVQATLEDIGNKQLSSSSDLAQDLTSFAKMAEAEAEQKDILADNQLKFNKHLGRAGLVFAAVVAIASKFAESVDAIGKQFGSLNVLSQGFQKNLFDSQEAAVGLGATMEDVVATANELSSEFGIGLEESATLSAQIMDTAKAVGLSNEEAAKLSGILQTTSGLSAEQAERLSEGAFQLAAANNVNPSAVLRDMAESSEEFAQFSKDGGDNLARAAVQARAMGLSLADTTKIASGLLDFEQSIAAEVEASVLIGRQLNLQKARELALTNAIEGAMRAVVDQLGSEAEFNKLNSIQRDALAKSIGVEASQLAKMVANSERANVAAGETAKSFADIIGKEAMSELTATINELKIFGVAIANTFGPLLMGLAKLVNLVLVPLGEGVAGISSAIRGTFGDAVTMNDGILGRGGISMMAGPAGVFKLNPRDSVMATTNPIPVNDVRSGPPGSMGEKQTIVMSARVRGRDLVFLNDRPNAGGDAGYEGLA